MRTPTDSQVSHGIAARAALARGTADRAALPRGIAARAAMWSARHRVLAIGGWLLFVVAVTIVAGQIGSVAATDADLGNGESARANRIIEAAGFPNHAAEMVLVHSDRVTADDPAFHAALTDVVSAIERTGEVESIRAPLDPAVTGQVSADQRSALVTFQMRGDKQTAPRRVGAVLEAVAGVQRAHPDFAIAQGGQASADRLVGESLDRSLNLLSLLSIPVSLGILLVAFGALVAAFLPVGLAMTAVVAAMGLLALVSHAAPTVDATMHVMLLVGLAVGVDYCLFYIRREREERDRGADPQAALAIAAQTSGRSVWVSGLTVIVAMAGMFLTRDTVFVSFAAGTILVVATAVGGSLTVLPALLSALGDRVDLGRIPGLYRRRAGGRVWRTVLGAVLSRPLLAALLATAALAALAAPALRLQTKAEDLEDLPQDIPVVQTFRRVQEAFPGGADPARVVVKAADVSSPAVTAAIARFRVAALATGRLHEPIATVVSPDRTVVVVSVGLDGQGTDAASRRALHTLRTEVIPGTLGAVPGAQVAVTGGTADSYDFNEALRGTAPLVFAFVLGLAFLLLLVSFRSIVVAVTAILLNLLSVTAAYGLLVLVFQDGWGERLFGLTTVTGITNWLPLLLFVILFGLSMDYHVFVLSRIREGHDRGLSTRQAVANGIVGTAGVVTSAAVVMVAVFALFATVPLASLQQTGVGLAAAILLDATVIRAVLLPAVMALLGERNWYLPRWLGWLPRLSAGEPAAVATGQRSIA